MYSISSAGGTGREAILEAFRDELIDAVEQGPAAVEKALAHRCAEDPELVDDFRKEAQAILLIWGLREPERLGAYKLLDVLAVGGMGNVYRAREDVAGRTVVVKTVLTGHLSSSQQVARFDTERRLLSRLHHTHIVPLLATGQEGYLFYLVMPYIPGVTLRALIATCSSHELADADLPTFEVLLAAASKAESSRQTTATFHPDLPLDPEQWAHSSETARPGRGHRPPGYLRRVVSMMEDVASAVQHIHDTRILHRDLKPSNIMIESSGHAWVIDIGVGREMDGAADQRSPAESSPEQFPSEMTRGVGTLLYMAPEQLPDYLSPPGATRPGTQDVRTDVWCLGATLYELITLRTPFEGANASEVACKILNEPPTRPRQHQPDIPRELEAICLKALEKDPERRYGKAANFAADLRRWLDSRPTIAGEAAARRTAAPLGWLWVWLRRLGFWAWRRPSAAALLIVLLVSGSAGAAVLAHVNRLNLDKARAEAETTQAELKAARREREILALPQFRRPIRQMKWFQSHWQNVRSLRGGSTSPDPQLQSQAAAALEGVDARVSKTMSGAAQVVEFDPGSERLLIVRAGKDAQGKPWSRTTLWDRTTDSILVERDLGSGVVAFRPDATPLQLSWVPGVPPEPPLCTKLKLTNVATGNTLREYRSPLEGLSHFQAIALSRSGINLAAVAIPVRRDRDRYTSEGDTRTIVVWDADSERAIRTLKHESTRDLILSPDGRLLVAWDTGGEITLWTLPDGKEYRRFRVGRAPVFCLAFGRDPMWHGDDSVPPWVLAVGESHGVVTVWDLRAHTPRSVCRGSYVDVRVIDFSADGALLLTGGRNPTKLWDVASGTCLLDLGIGDELRAIALAPDGRRYAVSSGQRGDEAVMIVELELGHGVRTLYGLRGRVEKTAFSPDDRLVAGATHEWEIGIWEWPSGGLRGVLPAPVGRFVDSIAMAFDADGRHFACSGGRRAQLWDLRSERPIKQWDLHEGLCDALAFLAPDRLLLVRSETQSGRDGPFSHVDFRVDPRVVRIYDLLGPTAPTALGEIADFPLHVHSVTLVPGGSAFLAEGVAMAGDRKARRSRIYDSTSGRLLHELPTMIDAVSPSMVYFDPGGRVLALVIDQGKEVGRFSLCDMPDLKFRGVAEAFYGSLSPGANWSMGLTTGQPAEPVLSDIARGRELLRIADDVGGHSLSFTFSPDGRCVVFGRRDGTVCVLDRVEVGQRLSELHLGW